MVTRIPAFVRSSSASIVGWLPVTALLAGGLVAFVWNYYPNQDDGDDRSVITVLPVNAKDFAYEDELAGVKARISVNQDLVQRVINEEVPFVDAVAEYWAVNHAAKGFAVSIESRYSGLSLQEGARINFLKLTLKRAEQNPETKSETQEKLLRRYEQTFGSFATENLF